MAWLAQNDLKGNGVRLFCLPHAGAGTAAFYRWKRLLPASISVCPVHLPGRERRMGEPSMTSAAGLAGQLVATTRELLSEPYAVFGHSMGSLLAYEFTRQIALAGLPEPRCLFVSGRNAPQLAPPHRGLHLLDDDDFLAALQARYGGSENGVLADAEMRTLFLPVLRADLQLVETYAHVPGSPLRCPIAAFAGADDRSVTEGGLEGWSELTSAWATAERFRGDHFYHLGAGQGALLGAMTEQMARAGLHGL